MMNEIVFPVPPVCTAFWTAADWDRYIAQNGRVVEEPREILAIGFRWVATDERDERGRMLYRAEGKVA